MLAGLRGETLVKKAPASTMKERLGTKGIGEEAAGPVASGDGAGAAIMEEEERNGNAPPIIQDDQERDEGESLDEMCTDVAMVQAGEVLGA